MAGISCFKFKIRPCVSLLWDLTVLIRIQVVCVLSHMYIEWVDYILSKAQLRIAFDLVGGVYVGTYDDIHTVGKLGMYVTPWCHSCMYGVRHIQI